MSGVPSWGWWAGRDEEWMSVGPMQTRDDVISEALANFGEGEGDFVILEGIMHEISLSASRIVDRAYDDWADGDLFSKEDQQAAEEELQTLLDGWVAKWRHTLPTPNMFAATRNQEVIRNTVDPDMLPGGHDNPRDPA